MGFKQWLCCRRASNGCGCRLRHQPSRPAGALTARSAAAIRVANVLIGVRARAANVIGCGCVRAWLCVDPSVCKRGVCGVGGQRKGQDGGEGAAGGAEHDRGAVAVRPERSERRHGGQARDAREA
eukprot:1390023-Pleurochrysis_carterae.AAC.1